MRALICGVGGQDGAYLARLLLKQGYEVIGTSRDAMTATFSSLDRLGIRHSLATVSMAINDFRSILSVLEKYSPDEVYNLAGQSSVGLSFEQPVETMDSITGGTLNLLEAIRFTHRPIRFYNAGSGECFGDTGDCRATEELHFTLVALMPLPKPLHIGLFATIENLTVFLPAPGYCSITNRRYDLSAL